MSKDDLSIRLKGDFMNLRKIINSYDLIPGSPSDEFDSLNYKILSHLYKDADFEKIKRVLESELTVNYGFFSDEVDADQMASEIMHWWNS